jgi:molybdopterin synthase catalytic subunit
VKITIRFFASVRDMLGTEVLEVDVDEGTTVEQLKAKLAERSPELVRMPVAYAVNQDYAEASRELREGDEVAFIPPISGGSGAAELYRFDLTREPIDPRSLEAEVRSDRDGAIVTFAGVTRDHNDGVAVASLSYECYEEMARKVMGQIFEEAVKRFEISRARVVHRLGDVPLGETSVLVAVAAEHRGAAFEASQFLMDRLKASVPIFKRELLAGKDGESRWVGELPSGPA